MDYFLRNLTDKPIRCDVINVVIPARGRMPRPLQLAEKNILDTCGITYDGLLLEPVLIESGSSELETRGVAAAEVVEAVVALPEETLALKRAGRKPRGE